MSAQQKLAFVTLLTQPSYLPGVLVLDFTLRSVGSQHPLVVMVTPTLPQAARDVLTRRGLQLQEIQPLWPHERVHRLATHDARFQDTWSKLRAFELVQFDRVVLLDADMIVMRNMDELFELDLPMEWISAVHVCCCNPRKLPHYPPDWVPENCPYTPLRHPTALENPTPITENSPRPHTLLNSGLVVLNPSAELANALYHHLHTSPLVPTWSFPDQDLLADFFQHRWKPLPWCYNALKTLMIIHEPLWRDEAVKCLHYILADKPWRARVSKDGKGEYDRCHRWWWDRLEQLSVDMQDSPEDCKFVQDILGKQ